MLSSIRGSTTQTVVKVHDSGINRTRGCFHRHEKQQPNPEGLVHIFRKLLRIFPGFLHCCPMHFRVSVIKLVKDRSHTLAFVPSKLPPCSTSLPVSPALFSPSWIAAFTAC